MILDPAASLHMSKEKLKQHKSSDGAETQQQVKDGVGKTKAGKKRKYFYEHQQKKPKEMKMGLFSPPTQAEDFSANWKTLLGMLNSTEKTSSSKKPESHQNKESHKTVHKEAKDTKKQTQKSHKDLYKASERVKIPRSQKAQEEQNGDGSKQHKTEKKRMKDGERGREKQKNKGKDIETVEKKTTEADIWFDDVDPDDIEAAVGLEAANIARKMSGKSAERNTEQLLVKENSCDGLTRAVAMDCEMVGVGPDGEESMLARVSIVNYFGKCLYDKYVKPTERVTDYRTAVSGIRPADIKDGEVFKTVQMEVAQILKGRILVGHAIHNDLKILLLDHPKKNIRDTQKYKPFRRIAKSGRPALRVLCREILHVKVQHGEHSSVQDAQATMRLYTMVKKKWEVEIKASKGQTKGQKSPRQPKVKTDLNRS
ncbi:RNA exonuclease 4 [Trichomycterus rosablanca]|uniref:RNA exonuclease 4 n=1 Tax=Trichomycterus rosablanca TaxID=2290929 RepID=UPI002F356F98